MPRYYAIGNPSDQRSSHAVEQAWHRGKRLPTTAVNYPDWRRCPRGASRERGARCQDGFRARANTPCQHSNPPEFTAPHLYVVARKQQLSFLRSAPRVRFERFPRNLPEISATVRYGAVRYGCILPRSGRTFRPSKSAYITGVHPRPSRSTELAPSSTRRATCCLLGACAQHIFGKGKQSLTLLLLQIVSYTNFRYVVPENMGAAYEETVDPVV